MDTTADGEARIAAVAASRDFGKATAVKRGRNPKYPFVPVVRFASALKGRSQTEQIRGKAFATREEAVAYAQKALDAGRADFARSLHVRRNRALREDWGLPAELSELPGVIEIKRDYR